MKTKVIALSAISSAFIAIFLIAGAYIDFADIGLTIVASIFIIMPLYFNSFTGCFLSYLAGGIIACLFSLPKVLASLVFPFYFLFCGPYVILRFVFIKRNISRNFIYIIGAIWALAVSIGLFYYYTLIMKMPIEDLPFNMQDYLVYIVGVIGLSFYFVYDTLIIRCKKLIDFYLRKIIKK